MSVSGAGDNGWEYLETPFGRFGTYCNPYGTRRVRVECTNSVQGPWMNESDFWKLMWETYNDNPEYAQFIAGRLLGKE